MKYVECGCCGDKFENDSAKKYIKARGMCQTCDEENEDDE